MAETNKFIQMQIELEQILIMFIILKFIILNWANNCHHVLILDLISNLFYKVKLLILQGEI